MKKSVKIAAVLAIGFAAAMLLMSVSIYFGYSNAYRTDAGQYTVRLLGLSIYELTKSGMAYSGAAIGQHMGIICGICMAVSFAAWKMVCKLRHR